MKQSEKVWILEIIEEHQKRQTSLLKLWRRDKASAVSWKEDDKDQHMVEWCEEKASGHLKMLRAQQQVIEELALFLELRTVKFQDEVLLIDQVSKFRSGTFVKDRWGLADKPRTGHERLICTRDRI